MEATSSVLVSPGVSRFTVPTRYTGRCLLCAGRSRAPGLPVELQTATSDEYRAVPRWQYPRRSGLLTWLLLVNIPSIAFLSLVAPYLAREVSPALFIIGVASLIINSVLMGVAGCSDPGTVPAAAFRSGTHDPRPREVLINGQRVTVKFCVACGIRVRAQSPNAESRTQAVTHCAATLRAQRPPRASHCRETNRCVDKWDHYCPWLGNSVGRRNYPWFVSFVMFTVMHAIYVGSCCVYQIQALAKGQAGPSRSLVGAASLSPAAVCHGP